MTYKMNIAGIEHELPICKLNDNLAIGAFVIFGNVELTCACAKALLEKIPEFDYMIAPEAKAIPLIYEMARQSGRNDYLLARKNKKAYMRSVFEVEVQSITTEGTQKLYMDGVDAEKMRGKRIVIIDDVISTGESLSAMEEFVNKAGGNIVARMAVLAEGEAANRDDIIFLEKLPLFKPDGTPIE